MIPGADLHSSTWRAVRRYTEERIAKLQVQLETQSDEVTTAALRGRIKELRDLIAASERRDAPMPAFNPKLSKVPLY